MTPLILPLSHPDLSLALAGGKGANLGRLTLLPGICVPKGFVITTTCYQNDVLPRISHLLPSLQEPGIKREIIVSVKEAIGSIVLSKQLQEELKAALAQFPDGTAFAVRSSATAEDLPEASFAGQQDSYLNVIGYDAVVSAVLSCFGSLFNVEAVAYRNKYGISHREVAMAVVVQEMVNARISGVLFTADPMTSDRFTCVVEAVEGLGEELVSGRKTPATWHLKDGAPITGESKLLHPRQLRELVGIGRKTEAAFGAPQDIEWCFADECFSIVQSRPITTLFPCPPSGDGFKRCYLSFGHMQMMTDAIRPLGISFMKMIALYQMAEAGGRLFVEITHDLNHVMGRAVLRKKTDGMDPLLFQSIEEIWGRKAYIRSIPKGVGSFQSAGSVAPMLREGIRLYRKNDPAIIREYICRQEEAVRKLEQALSARTGLDALEYMEQDQQGSGQIVYDAVGFGAIAAAQYALMQIDRAGKRLTGEEKLSNRLSGSVDNNPTSEMGRSLSDVADAASTNPAALRLLEQAEDTFIPDDLRRVTGGEELANALESFLERYGARCPGEIDITRPRFREQPSLLLASLLSSIRSHPPGYGVASFQKGKAEAERLAEEICLLARERLGQRGEKNLRRQISVFRTYAGMREYPKYYMIRRYWVYKQAILRIADDLRQRGCLRDKEDIFYLYFDELGPAVQRGAVNTAVIEQRKKAYAANTTLTPPRLMFSDGEVPSPRYNKPIPVGALPGLAVSGGIVEGRARVVSTMQEAIFENGDILVTAFTDPSWTPAFVSIAGLVTEVGGMMTHGAVITREYGLPAVVGVLGATRLIRDGERIRVNGNNGFVELINRTEYQESITTVKGYLV